MELLHNVCLVIANIKAGERGSKKIFVYIPGNLYFYVD